MIVHLKEACDRQLLKQFARSYVATRVRLDDKDLAILPASVKTLDERFLPLVEAIHVLDSDMQLASRAYRPQTRSIKLDHLEIGGETSATLLMAGPCSVESQEQIDVVADHLVELGIGVLRAGCFKPRTSPYSFQGLGTEGLEILDRTRRRTGLKIISEVRDATHVDEVIEATDIVQIGAKAMYDHGILRRCGKAGKPILLKRFFGATLQEFVQAAEFIMSSGNSQVILCERGIRTFETKTRFTLDLCGVAYLQEYSNLPIVVDTSHAMGYRYGISNLTRAAAAMGIDGLLIEAHPDPSSAKSDAAQQIELPALTELKDEVTRVLSAVGRVLV